MELEAAILEIYPNAIVDQDFLISFDFDLGEPVIEMWNTEKYPKPSKEQLEDAWERVVAKRQRNQEIQDMKDYLNETDFYYVRQIDSGKPVPYDVKQKRDEIRKRLVELGL